MLVDTWGLQVGALCWVGRAQRAGVQDQVTPRDEMEGQGLHDHLDEEVQEGLVAGGWDWTLETCRGQQRDSVMLIENTASLSHLNCLYLRPEGIPVTCNQESSTGGGIAVVIVDVLMSPMMLRPSRRAWYIFNISSRC